MKTRKEKDAEYHKRWYEANKESRKEQMRTYYKNNKHKFNRYPTNVPPEVQRERSAASGRKRYHRRKGEEPSCVYEILNTVTNRAYIGHTTIGCMRWETHLKKLKSNFHPHLDLQADFNKYGLDAFEWKILKEVPDNKEALLVEEARVIQQYFEQGRELYNSLLHKNNWRSNEKDNTC